MVVVEVVTVVATIATVVNPTHSDYQQQISKREANASLFCYRLDDYLIYLGCFTERNSSRKINTHK